MAESTTVTAQATPVSVTSTSTGGTLGSELRTGEFTLGSGRLGTAKTTQEASPSASIATPQTAPTGGTVSSTQTSTLFLTQSPLQ